MKLPRKNRKRQPLTYGGYKDFKSLISKIEKELPRDKREEFDALTVAMLGFIVGLLIASLLSESKESN
mgnify:CR=1 FL=1